MWICSIDPGVTGGIVFYNTESKQVDVHDPPVESVSVGKRKSKKTGETTERFRTKYKESDILSLIRSYNPEVLILEQVGSRPNDGPIQSFSLGEAYGLYKGLFRACGSRIVLCRPQVWKKALKLKSGATKEDSRQLALTLFPKKSEELRFKKNEGRAESLLILHYYLNHYKDE